MNANEDLKNLIKEFQEEIKSQQRELDELKKFLDNQQNKLNDKRKILYLLETKLNRLAAAMINQNSQAVQTPAQINYQPTRYSSTQNNSPAKSPIQIKQNNLQSLIKPKQQSPAQIKNQSSLPDNVTNEFNALADVQDRFTWKKSRDEFVQKYKVRAFSCTNFEARVSEPVPPPQFEESENIISGEYWAINNKGNVFLVFPNVRQYTDNYHNQRAMGEIFSSNFESGKTYGKIFVRQPAMFECNGNIWRMRVRGILRLE